MDLDNAPSFIKAILSKPFKFWCCSNPDHKLVKWNENGTQATCESCGEQSPIKQSN